MNLHGEVLVPRAALVGFKDFVNRFTNPQGITGEEAQEKLRWLDSLLEEPDAEEEWAALKALVEQQAKDEGLWFVAKTAPEG